MGKVCTVMEKLDSRKGIGWKHIAWTTPGGRYLFAIAVLISCFAAFGNYAAVFYEQCLIIPCALFLGAQPEIGSKLAGKKRFWVAGAMVVWFLFLQGKRSLEQAGIANIGMFLSVYLFAFPLASLLEDGDRRKALKLFAGGYLAAAAVLCIQGVLLVCDLLPRCLSQWVFWDGGRITIIWHSNITACLFMIGIFWGTTFWSEATSPWARIGLTVLMAGMCGIMALTNCRTGILLTGAYLGAAAFFGMVHRGKKWFVPGVLIALIILAGFYKGSQFLYEGNCDRLLAKYTQQYAQQQAADSDTSTSEEANSEQQAASADASASDAAEPEPLPVEVDPATGEVHLITQSGQGSLSQDLGSFNGRFSIWRSALYALRESRAILLWGIDNPGWYVSFYNAFDIFHLHNAWLECLVGLGLMGFLLAAVLTVMTVWNCLVVLLKHHQDIWKRNVAMLALWLMAAAVIEPYLFCTTNGYHLFDFLFFLCAGYLAHWQEGDNHRIWQKIFQIIA